jgi:rhodanese-related sulfurtransferase
MATIDELLSAARARISRYRPGEVPPGSRLIDIRSSDARVRDGVVPGALHIPRTVLEWRLDPEGAWRTPHIDGTESVVLICDHGYSSSLAAATLLELGRDAGDVIGGFEAWAAAGLPVGECRATPDSGLPGTGPPD